MTCLQHFRLPIRPLPEAPFSELKAYEEEAKHASDGLQDELSFTMDQLDQHVKLAKKELQLLDGFLAALRKHSA